MLTCRCGFEGDAPLDARLDRQERTARTPPRPQPSIGKSRQYQYRTPETFCGGSNRIRSNKIQKQIRPCSTNLGTARPGWRLVTVQPGSYLHSLWICSGKSAPTLLARC